MSVERRPLTLADKRLKVAILNDAKNVETIRKIIKEEGANVNAVYELDDTPLGMAANKGKADVVRELILAKARLEAPHGRLGGETALLIAVRQGHTPVITQLLEAKADVATRDPHGRTSLGLAAQTGNTEVVQQLIHARARLENVSGFGDETPLLIAARNGHTAVVTQLLEAKANAAAADRHGQTLLSLAAKKGDAEAVQRLILANARLEDINRQGSTPLLIAAGEGHTAVVIQLLEAKANAKATDSYGQTPLSLAVEKGDAEAAQRLIAAKANLEVIDYIGDTLLLSAIRKNRPAIAIQLLDAKADPGTANAGNPKMTPLMLAEGNTDLINHLHSAMQNRQFLTLLMGTHQRAGVRSDLSTVAKRPLFDPQVMRVVKSSFFSQQDTSQDSVKTVAIKESTPTFAHKRRKT